MMLDPVGNLVLCVPYLGEAALVLALESVGNLLVVDVQVVTLGFEELVLPVVVVEDGSQCCGEEESQELLLLRLVEDEELKEIE